MVKVSKFLKIAVIAILAGVTIFALRGGRDYTNATVSFDRKIVGLLRVHGITAEDLLYEKRETDKGKRQIFLKMVLKYKVSPQFDCDAFVIEAKEHIKPLKWKIVKTVFEKKTGMEGETGYELFTVFFAFKQRVLYELSFVRKEHSGYPPHTISSGEPKRGKAQIAIVLDDFGYNINDLDALFEMDIPLTISVLPNLPYSTEIAKECGKRKIEVLLHLPMEPHGDANNLERNTILVNMKRDEVREILSQAITSVPGLRGVSNHMGSKATEDQTLMTFIFEELRGRGLYFLDNLVTDRSVCTKVASAIGIPIAKRSIFLDNKADRSYITEQLHKTASWAGKTGRAIAVGHDRPLTIDVLQKTVPQLLDEGYNFVYVSELLKRDDYFRD